MIHVDPQGFPHDARHRVKGRPHLTDIGCAKAARGGHFYLVPVPKCRLDLAKHSGKSLLISGRIVENPEARFSRTPRTEEK